MLSLALFASLVAPAAAARRVLPGSQSAALQLAAQHEALPSAPLVKQWCALKDDELSCPPGNVISIYSAFYSRQQRSCKSPTKPKQPRSNCKPNVTEEFIAECNGKGSCPRSVASQPKPCEEYPWTSVRVRYSCNEGVAPTAPPATPVNMEPEPSLAVCTRELERYTDVLAPLGEKLEVFNCECGLLPQDVLKDESEKEYQIIDDTRICSEGCKNARKPISMLELPSAAVLLDLGNRCPLPPKDSAKLRQLHAMRSLVGALEAAQDDCPEKKKAEEEAEASALLCPDASMVRYDCGELKSDKASCEASGCCWDPLPKDADRPGRPWCYKAKKDVQCKPQCPPTGHQPFWHEDLAWREDCTSFLALDDSRNKDDSIREQACVSMGCCWQPLEHGSKEPWCFHKPCLEV